MDYLCAKFVAIIVSAGLVLSCGQTDRITEADDRYTHATTVGVRINFKQLPEHI